MEDPSITKMLEGTMTEAFGVQRNKPSLEAPIGQTIIAQQYKTTKSPAGVDAKEDTTTEEPEERELEERPDVSQSETSPILRTSSEPLRPKSPQARYLWSRKTARLLCR
jgi:hypothetical protein